MITPALNLSGAEGTLLASLVARLQSRPSLPPLVPREPWNEGLQSVLEGMNEADLLEGMTLKDPASAKAIKSGLLLWNDATHASHELSQGIESETGSYWHGIMHRREPDFPNAKYWFRRVGDHPIFPALREQALGVFGEKTDSSEYARTMHAQIESQPKWDPYAFIDMCEEAVRQPQRHADAASLLEAVQLREIELLLTHSYRSAVGNS